MQKHVTRWVQPRFAQLKAQSERGMAIAEYAIGIFVIGAVVALAMAMMKELVPSLMEGVISAAFSAFK